MSKGIKITLITLGILVGIVFINGCYYVFCHQDKSMAKVQQGKELNVYECGSIYTMHCALWMFGWPLSPEAAKECFLLHFPHEKTDTVYLSYSKKFINSVKLQRAIKSLENKPIGKSIYVPWNGKEAYSIRSTECRASIAVNPCQVTKVADGIEITSPMLFPKYSKTPLDCGAFTITLHEGLFRYLQDRGWLSKYIACYKVESII